MDKLDPKNTSSNELCKSLDKIVNISIRPAEMRDIEKLIFLSKKAFSENIKDNFPPKIAKRYWVKLINSRNIKIFILELNDKISGYYILVINISEYRKELEKIGSLMRVSMFIGRLLSICNILKSGSIKIAKLLELMSDWMLIRDIKKVNDKMEHEEDYFCWCDTIAISSQCQKNGYGKMLIEHAIKECRKYSKQFIGATVELNNFSSNKLFLSMGFNACNRIKNKITYKKYIEVISAG